MTQKDLSDKLSLTPKTISFYELSERVPPPDVLEKIADIFEVTTDYLLGRTDWITCTTCYVSYDPLNQHNALEHEKFHSKYKNAVAKFGEITPYRIAFEKRNEAIQQFRTRNATLDERVIAYGEFLKAEFTLSLMKSDLNINHDDFVTFCKKDIGLQETKDATKQYDGFYEKLVEVFGIADNNLYHGINGINLSESQDKLLKNFNRLNEIGQIKILNMLDDMLKIYGTE